MKGGGGVVFQSDPYSVLLVSAGEKFNTAALALLPNTDFWPVTIAGSLSRARRLGVEAQYDLVIVNTPLPDGLGVDLATEISAETDAAVLLLIRSELYEETHAKVLPSGVMTLSKPTSTPMLAQSLRALCAMRERLRAVRDRQATVEEKIEEIRLVNRAKWLLIEREGLTEPEAHRLIMREAMDSHRTKRAVAQEILRKYE